MARAYQQFEARAFHPDLGNESIDGVIFFTSDVLSFRAGTTAIDIPLQRLGAEFEDAGDGRIILRDPVQPDWTIITWDQTVLEFRSVKSIYRLVKRLESQGARRDLTHRLKVVGIFFVAAVLVIWLGMLATGAMVRAIVSKIPPEKEREFGKAWLEESKAELQFLDDSNKVARLTAMAEPLLKALPPGQQWEFYIVEEPYPNAFALPGGHIVVTTGLLELAERPEELLAVVAHEVAHVTRKHSFRQTVASAGPFLVLQVFLAGHGGALGVIAGGSAILVHQSFSQEYEKEADDYGWDYLVAANIDPRGMIDMFQRLKTVEAAEALSEIVPKAFQSHPDIDKRIARLKAKWKKLSRKSGFIELSNASIESGL